MYGPGGGIGLVGWKRMIDVVVRSMRDLPWTTPMPGHISVARTPYSILAKSASVPSSVGLLNLVNRKLGGKSWGPISYFWSESFSYWP